MCREPLPRGIPAGGTSHVPLGVSTEPPILLEMRNAQSPEPRGAPRALRVGSQPRSCRVSVHPALLIPGSATCLCPTNRFPFYFELKIAFVIWLLSPYTKGSSVLYRKFVHPTLSNKEKVCPHSPLTSSPAPGRGSPVPAAVYIPGSPCGCPEPEAIWQGPGLREQAVPLSRWEQGQAGPGQWGPPLTSCSFASNPSGDRRVHHTGPRQEL